MSFNVNFRFIKLLVTLSAYEVRYVSSNLRFDILNKLQKPEYYFDVKIKGILMLAYARRKTGMGLMYGPIQRFNHISTTPVNFTS